MRLSIALLVEGDGEVEAVPILLRRICQAIDPLATVEIVHRSRVPATLLLKSGGLERAIDLLARRAGTEAKLLTLLDCEDRCPAELGPELLARARRARSDRELLVVLARREFETWFLAAAESLRGRRGLLPDLSPPPDPESIRDAKGWLSARMIKGRGYSAPVDQPALAKLFDLTAARRIASFDRLYRKMAALLL
jgi:uncharacterized protein DUF4276